MRWLATLLPALLSFQAASYCQTYDVGPGQPLTDINDVPWHTLSAGDTVRIHYRSTPYRSKWVLCRQGTLASPITVSGVADGSGNLPVINGSGATTPAPLNFTNEDRGIIKIGSANVPPDTTPRYIVVENLDIRCARPGYYYTGDDDNTYEYRNNAGPIYIEKGENITIRNCILHDGANGIAAMSGSIIKDLTIEGCYIYGNGLSGSITEHNTYTGADGITYQYNFFGPLRSGAGGNNLKDRSAGCVIRYNWIESGGRQLDLVDSGDPAVYGLSSYNSTFVYGNVLVEPAGAGNSQIVHYGGDTGTTSRYRKGTLYFYNNTVISKRTDNTTLLRLSSSGESADCRNNIIYVTADGFRLAVTLTDGTLDFQYNCMKPGWIVTHSPPFAGTFNNLGGNIEVDDPGFMDEAAQDYQLHSSSPCIDAGTTLQAAVLPANNHLWQPFDGILDIGAYEYGSSLSSGRPIGGNLGGAGGGTQPGSGGCAASIDPGAAPDPLDFAGSLLPFLLLSAAFFTRRSLRKDRRPESRVR